MPTRKPSVSSDTRHPKSEQWGITVSLHRDSIREGFNVTPQVVVMLQESDARWLEWVLEQQRHPQARRIRQALLRALDGDDEGRVETKA